MKYLAQINIAKLLKPIDHPQITEFRENIDRINALAEQSEGFIWRLKDEYGSAVSIQAFNDPLMIVNMSVWRSVEDLKNYVYNSGHVEIMRNRKHWFQKHVSQHLAMWWVDTDHVPTLEEGKAKLEYLQENGDTDYAFGFRYAMNRAESA